MGSVRSQDSPCTPPWRRGRNHTRSSTDCAATISRPAISENRLSLTPNGNVHYQLKTPYRDGTTHVIFEPLDFIARLAALIPKPRVHTTWQSAFRLPDRTHDRVFANRKSGTEKKTTS